MDRCHALRRSLFIDIDTSCRRQVCCEARYAKPLEGVSSTLRVKKKRDDERDMDAGQRNLYDLPVGTSAHYASIVKRADT